MPSGLLLEDCAGVQSVFKPIGSFAGHGLLPTEVVSICADLGITGERIHVAMTPITIPMTRLTKTGCFLRLFIIRVLTYLSNRTRTLYNIVQSVATMLSPYGYP